MARIVVSTYMVRYPLGGTLSWALQWLIGFEQLGHDVYIVEKSGYANSCFDLSKGIMTDDCSYGVTLVSSLLKRFGLQNKWCYVDAQGQYYGIRKEDVGKIFKAADLFVDMGTHGTEMEGTWLEEASDANLRILVATEPGSTQIRMEKKLVIGEQLPQYDLYYTTGKNIGTQRSTAPTAGREWHQIFDPIVMSLFPFQPILYDAPFTTVMNWQSHEQLEFNGSIYGQKDAEFMKFIDLPSLTRTPLELAVAGKLAPMKKLLEAKWRVQDAHEVSVSIDSYWDYLAASKGEFSVCKNVCVAMNTGWFSARSAEYLAIGRPVVIQDTGFSHHLPCGRGIFAVKNVDEAASAIEEINGNYDHHSKWARTMASEYFDSQKVLGTFLAEVGL